MMSIVTGQQKCHHHEEHYEVRVQADPGGSFYTDGDGPQTHYPDGASAAEWARKVTPYFHCVRVTRVMTDWHMPDDFPAGQ